MDIASVALQLYTVRDETARDFRQTVREVARIGYKGVEFAGYGGLGSDEMTALLQETALRAASSHVGLQALEERLGDEIAYCLAIGCSYLVLPSLPKDRYNGASIREFAQRANEIGRRCHDKGLTFAFHNHFNEFLLDNGQYLLDILLQETDPRYVQLELDTYWAAYAKIDPIAYLKQHTGRIPLIHLKDMTPERTFTEVGDGTLDIRSYYQTAQESGTTYFIVENDAPTIPSLESARRSFAYLRTL